MTGSPLDREWVEQKLADAFDLPVEILRLSDWQFHWWLRNTASGRALVEAEETPGQTSNRIDSKARKRLGW